MNRCKTRPSSFDSTTQRHRDRSRQKSAVPAYRGHTRPLTNTERRSARSRAHVKTPASVSTAILKPSLHEQQSCGWSRLRERRTAVCPDGEAIQGHAKRTMWMANKKLPSAFFESSLRPILDASIRGGAASSLARSTQREGEGEGKKFQLFSKPRPLKTHDSSSLPLTASSSRYIEHNHAKEGYEGEVKDDQC